MAMSERDPGLQPERTAISWTRTVYVLLAVMALYAKSAIHMKSFTLGLCAVLFFLSALLGLLMQQRRVQLLADASANECDIILKMVISANLSLAALMTLIYIIK